MLAAVEPWHGSSVVIYAEEKGMWTRTVIETAITGGARVGLGRLRRRRIG